MVNTTQALNTVFRTCPDTGLKFHGPAENLIKANAGRLCTCWAPKIFTWYLPPTV
jgi:hypothetical protein